MINSYCVSVTSPPPSHSSSTGPLRTPILIRLFEPSSSSSSPTPPAQLLLQIFESIALSQPDDSSLSSSSSSPPSLSRLEHRQTVVACANIQMCTRVTWGGGHGTRCKHTQPNKCQLAHDDIKTGKKILPHTDASDNVRFMHVLRQCTCTCKKNHVLLIPRCGHRSGLVFERFVPVRVIDFISTCHPCWHKHKHHLSPRLFVLPKTSFDFIFWFLDL